MQPLIPLIIHQMWLDEKNPDCQSPPEKYVKKGYPQSFQRNQPHWKYMFWNLTEVYNLFTHSTLQVFQSYFHELQPLIKKCDFARHAVLYLYGGIYVDLDFVSLRPLDILVKGRKYLFVREMFYFIPYKYRCVCNGFYGSAPGQPLLPFCMQEMMKYKRKHRIPGQDVVYHTGPFGLRRYIESFQKKTGIRAPDLFIPSLYVFSCPRNLVVVLAKFRLSHWVPRKSLYVCTEWTEGTNWDKIKPSKTRSLFL